MFETLRQRLRDAGTLKTLCSQAEQQALATGHRLPGAEHFVWAALGLPDQTAQRVLQRLAGPGRPIGALGPLGPLGTPAAAAAFAAAVEQQYHQALQQAGLPLEGTNLAPDFGTPRPQPKGAYACQPSAQALMQVLTRDVMVAAQKQNARTPLLGAHVLLAAAAAPYGVCARAFRVLGSSAPQVAQAAQAELAEWATGTAPQAAA